MSKNYDVIVIGAGNGGLAAAAKCAKAGLSTLLLERHNIPGGSASSFVRGRFEFEPSLHELSGIGTPEEPGMIEVFFNSLGADVDWVKENSTFRLIVPAKEGDTDTFLNETGVEVTVDVRMPVGFQNFSRKLDELVPGSYQSSMAAFDLAERFYKAVEGMDGDTLTPASIGNLVKNLPDVMRMTSHTLQEALDALGMPKKAQGIFSTYWSYMGSPASRFDFLYYMAMLHGYIKNGAGMPRLRSHAMSLAIDKVIRDNGGDIWYNSEVTKVIMKNGKPAGVVINGEKEVYGKRFICNAAPNFVWNDLFEQKDIPPRQLKMSNARQIAAALTTVYLGINIPKEKLGMHDYSVFVAPDINSDEQYKTCMDFGGGYCIINCMNTAIPDFSPEGTCALFLTSMTFGDVMKNVRPQDYKKFKTKVATDMIETCERALGIEIKPYIEEIEIALPPTFSRYLNTPQGTPYGYMRDMWDSMIPRTVQYIKDQPFDNFLFCGATQERGDGYGCAYHTGEKAASLTIKALKEGK